MSNFLTSNYLISGGSGGGGGNYYSPATTGTTISSASIAGISINSTSVTCPGNLYVGGNIIFGQPGQQDEPDYTRESFTMLMIKLVKEQSEVAALKRHVELLTRKLNDLSNPV